MSVKYPTYVNLTSLSEIQPNEITSSPPPRKKSLSLPQAPSKSISSKSTHYTSSTSSSESPTPTHVAPPPKLCFLISIKQEPQEHSPLQMSPNNPRVSMMDNWPSGPSNPSIPPRVSRPPPGFPNPPPGFEPLPSTQPLFVNMMRYFSFGRYLDELHVTWAHLEKNIRDYELAPRLLKICAHRT
ncbi:hypothetical protein Tco_0639708 [Tanacetum coccineum]